MILQQAEKKGQQRKIYLVRSKAYKYEIIFATPAQIYFKKLKDK